MRRSAASPRRRFDLHQIDQLTAVITRLADELEGAAKTGDELRRLGAVPGIGPVTPGTAHTSFVPGAWSRPADIDQKTGP